MTARDNKALMTEIFADLARGDGARFWEMLADDVVFTVTGAYSWSRTINGKDNIGRFFRVVADLAPGVRKTVPSRILADEDWVIVEARGDMTSRSGAPYNNHYCLMYRLRDGRIVEMKEYQDSHLCERVLGAFPEERMQV